KDWIGGLNIDGFTGATPLALQKFQHIEVSGLDLFTGMVAGSAGETSALLIMVCGLWLAYQRLLDWKIPVGVMLGAVLFGHEQMQVAIQAIRELAAEVNKKPLAWTPAETNPALAAAVEAIAAERLGAA
ncbi:hypothetical protein EO238_24285, partial [Citrobacter sp. AAK_AS5]